MKKRSGQILILVLLIVVVALAIGLSIASRNLTNLRTSTQTEQSQRAFNAAEGGVEDVLSRLTSDYSSLSAGASKTTPVNVGNIIANVSVKAAGDFESVIELGTVGQIILAGTSPCSQCLQVEWAKSGESPASVELNEIYGNPPSQDRSAWTGGSHPADESGNFQGVNSCTSDYSKCAKIDLKSGAQVLRIRPFWLRNTFRISCISGFSCMSGTTGTLPVQTYQISSIAATDLGITRKVQVQRAALPALPAVFDYVLYSGGAISK